MHNVPIAVGGTGLLFKTYCTMIQLKRGELFQLVCRQCNELSLFPVGFNKIIPANDLIAIKSPISRGNRRGLNYKGKLNLCYHNDACLFCRTSTKNEPFRRCREYFISEPLILDFSRSLSTSFSLMVYFTIHL